MESPNIGEFSSYAGACLDIHQGVFGYSPDISTVLRRYSAISEAGQCCYVSQSCLAVVAAAVCDARVTGEFPVRT